MTKTQELNQCDGPHRPTAEQLGLALLRNIPGHLEVRAVSIKGQGGGIWVECYHDGADIIYELNEHMQFALAHAIVRTNTRCS